MNRLFLFIIVLIVTGCASPQKPSYPVRELPSASAMYPSPDGRLYVTIRHTKAPFTVALIDRESGRILGVARSSARLNQEGDKLQGEVRVSYADDMSAIVVHEEFSDASPNPRYILFLRDKGGSIYHGSYFAPPTAHTDAPGEFDFICPSISQVTRDAITLNYYDASQSRSIPIANLLRTTTPRSSQEWPSEDYKRYE